MGYFAYLCYTKDSNEPDIKFDQSEAVKYSLILPIQFSVLHDWTKRDKELYDETYRN